MNVYYADKTDDYMKYEQMVFKIPHGNYEFDDIIDVLTKQKIYKDTRMEISLDKITLRCKIKCDWVVDFTYANSIGSLLRFEKRLLKPGKTHISDHMPEIFESY